MSQLTIKVRGEIVRQGLQDLSAELPKVGRRGIRAMLNRVVRKMQEYPPEPAHRTRSSSHSVLGLIYTKTGRTGRYFRSWKIEQVTNGYKLSNTAENKGHAYAIHVGGDAYGQNQREWSGGKYGTPGSMKAYGWKLTRDVVDEEVSSLPNVIEKEIMMVARRVNLV
jgi:hypothetical protein